MKVHIDQRHLMNEVQKILNREWDPIEVADVLDDEYDCYCAPITQILDDLHTQPDDLFKYLESIEIEQMKLTHQVEQRLTHRTNTVEKLWKLHISLSKNNH